MAETLSVVDMLPNKFEPKRQYRWVFSIEGIDAFLMKSTARPSYTIAETTLDDVRREVFETRQGNTNWNYESIKKEA